MPTKPERTLAAHVQAAIAAHGLGVQAKVTGALSGSREVAEHVQRAVARATQAKLQGVVGPLLPAAAQVQHALPGAVQAKGPAQSAPARMKPPANPERHPNRTGQALFRRGQILGASVQTSRKRKQIGSLRAKTRKKLKAAGLDEKNILPVSVDYLGRPLDVTRTGRPRRHGIPPAPFLPGTPPGYGEVPSDHKHADLRGKVWFASVPIRLWWKRPRRQVDGFLYRGSRALDITYLETNVASQAGFTWHHCADWRAGGAYGRGTMQLVPTDEHASWGHSGGVEQAAAAGHGGYM